MDPGAEVANHLDEVSAQPRLEAVHDDEFEDSSLAGGSSDADMRRSDRCCITWHLVPFVIGTS